MRRLRLALAACAISVGVLGLTGCPGTAYAHCQNQKPAGTTVFCSRKGSLGWIRCGAYRNDAPSIRKYWLIRESDHRVAAAYSC